MLPLTTAVAEDWLQFRGPNGSGVSTSTGLPTEFGPEKNVVWKTPLPPGHSSPVLTRDRIFLTAYSIKSDGVGNKASAATKPGEPSVEKQDYKLLVICLDRASGKLLWQREIPRSTVGRLQNVNGPASPSPVTDGSNVYVFFQEFGMISYDGAGKERWRLPLGPFNMFYGFGASPILVDDKLILPVDQDDPSSYLIAVDKNTGRVRWKVDRPVVISGYSTPIIYQPKGSEAVVLIHGWTCNIDSWRDQIPDFAKRNRVIAIDLPGHGQSDKPQITYSMELFARAVEAVMRDAKVKRAVLVGHSMGTPVARQFYRKYPDKTIAIVIVDGALKAWADKATMDKMIENFRGPNYRATVDQMLSMMNGPGLPAEAQQRINASTRNTPQHVLVSAMEGMADPSIWGDDKINVPVLAIMARNPFYPPNMEAMYRELVPNLEFQMWDGVGHFIMMEKPKEFNAAVVAFLDKNGLVKK
jgi:pimeloyl-ACP methyl ester carboxylesterase